MGGLAPADQFQTKDSLFFGHYLSDIASVKGDAEISANRLQGFLGAIVPSCFLISCNEDAQREILLSQPLFPGLVKMLSEENHGERHRILVVKAAPAIELPVFFLWLKKLIRCIHHVDVAHEQDGGKIRSGKSRNGGNPVAFDAPAARADILQKALDEVGAPFYFVRSGEHGLEANQVFGEIKDILHERSCESAGSLSKELVTSNKSLSQSKDLWQGLLKMRDKGTEAQSRKNALLFPLSLSFS